MPNETRYLGFRHTTGDASRAPWVGAILVPTDARDLHLASAADEATDWNVANPSHPTLYIHSETTPATDYVAISHDGTTVTIAVAGGTTLSLTGADLLIENGQGVVIGHTAQITFNALVPELQVLGNTVGVDGAMAVALYSATAAQGPEITLGRSKSGTLGTNTIVASGDVLGTIIAMGADGGTGFDPSASIRFEVDGTPGAATDMPGRILFLTSPDGSQTQTERFRVASDGNIYVVAGNGIVVGHSAQIWQGNLGESAVTSEVQVIGTSAPGASLGIQMYRVADNLGAALLLSRSRSTQAIGTHTALQTGDQIGQISFSGSDGVDFESPGAVIAADADGNYAENDTPGRLLLYTTPTGASAPIERLRIASTGHITIAAGSTPASVATTPGTAHAGSITATGGLGGNTTIATTGVGGIGAGFSFTGGAGGTANSATTAATGGAGGAWVTTTGAGAAAAVAGVGSTGGAGGAITLTTGAGGAVSLAVSGTATGGAAGLLTIQGGVGGAVTATTGTNVGGAGGGISLIAGAGGAASGATDTGGAGGIITLTPGAGGTGDANAAGKAGFISITTSYIRRSVQTIDMADAAVTLTVVPGTPVGTTMTSDVLYVDANSGTTENLLLPPEADLTGIILVIVNTGGESINIQNDAGGAVLTLELNNTAIITCDGTTLRGVVGVP